VEVVASRLRARGKLDTLVAARDATDEELLRVHASDYVELVKREAGSIGKPGYLSTGDVVIDHRSLAVARRAAGGAICAIETAAARRRPVFALIRPPGHHAESRRGMGFCLFNNAAIAARAYQAMFGGRVLIVDFDYHHGNGTQDVAGNGLSYVSTHAFPAYPGTGREDVEVDGGMVVNVPLSASGIATETFIGTWERLLPEIARATRPDAIVVSAGFDYVKGDPVGDLGVEIEAATDLANLISTIAVDCNAALAYVLEGGYNIDALTDSIERVIDASATLS
jgi:acetoin utilization deacetylase AcuC-like enzyme